MNFRTEIEITKSSKPITYHHKMMFVGSCFATNMGEMVLSKFFPTLVNPFGVLFNPVSVADGIRILIQNKTFTQADLNFHNELWFSYKHHTSFSSPQADECLKKINTAVNHASQFLQKSDFLFITFGTAWIYELIQTGEVVSNCHKIKASNFKRRLLTINEIVKQYNELVEELRMFNPKLSIIFTVSPVRHLKDSAHGNQLSKSVLLLAIILLL